MSPRQRWMIFVASTGGALEVFDYAVYGFFAQSIGREFFPARIGLPAETLSFAVLAAGSMSRLVGGIFLGRLGDKYGRRIVFTSSAMVAAVSTLLIAILPSYESLGVGAPMLLVLLRITQGLCLGGELPGAVIYAVETAHAKPGILCGMVFLAVNIALMLAISINLGVQMILTSDQVRAFGWRIGFLVGGILGLLSFVVRRTLAETDEYARGVSARHREPLAVLFRKHAASVLTGVAAASLVGASSGLFVAHMPAYLQTLHYAPRKIASAQFLYVAAISGCILVTAYFGELLSRRYVFMSGAVLSALFAPFFYVAVTRHQVSLPLLFLMAGVVASFANGTYACAIAEMFPVDVRFSGLATAMNVGLAAPMAIAPLAASILASTTNWTFSPALVVVLCATFAFVASFRMKRHREEAVSVKMGNESLFQERK
ncbi:MULTISPECIES: MFS transporter [Paraburkholderia]|uniref:MFS transporter n=1 Tax=Paraburkholderia TaxID=1822464 RepID=UPI001BA9129B|nr:MULTISPECIES: MFS transporter [Paraburkholderia]MCX4152615.1 MFS transporter [Paraburkholderia aspalathi]MDN7162030.1 MFS transporter [Paraburkholderia sp. SECH2]MDQ6390516.1 MFS transporter [Paraburkholderia aspalathi]